MVESAASPAGPSDGGTKPGYRAQLVAFLERNALPVHKFGHQPRLYALTTEIGRGMSYDDDVVFAAVWLHDLGVFVGHRPEEPEALRRWNHVAYVKDKAPEILHSIGFPSEKIPAVLKVIEQHQPQDHPGSLESVLVRDADILEQLGAIGILRTAAKVGSDTRFATFAEACESLRRAADVLPGMLKLPAARAMAEPKAEAMRIFLAAASAEGLPELY